MKKIALLISILAFNSSYAGFNGLTHHSRANCGNNESISWDYLEEHVLKVQSIHINLKTGVMVHMEETPMSKTWRQAAVHWGEGGCPTAVEKNWGVTGNHFTQGSHGEWILLQNEYVTDCDVYNGWWDKDHK